MTREEAIITKIEKQLKSMLMEESTLLRFNVDELMILRNALKQIDKPKWHKVSEVSPKLNEAVNVACKCKDNGKVYTGFGRRITECNWDLSISTPDFQQGVLDIEVEVIAWQKIEPYEEDK